VIGGNNEFEKVLDTWHEVPYEAIPLNAWQERIAKNVSPFMAQHLAEVAKDHTEGIFSGTNDLVKTITGKDPIGLREFIEKKQRCVRTGRF
jgi:hypothetical protein